MSIFASQTQTTIEIQFDAPHTITIRKLTGREFEQVQEAFALGVATGRARTYATQFRRVLTNGTAAEADVQKAIADPLLGFDRLAVVRAALVAWSYPQSITPVVATDKAQAVDAIADLDDEALEFIATEILKLTKPTLFVTTVDEAKDAQKNGSSSSTAV